MDDLSMGVLLRQERLTHMSDQSFLNDIISERMEMHYSSYSKSNTDELNSILKLDDEYAKALETLPKETKKVIDDYISSLHRQAGKDEMFFYKKGVKDGLLLYELLTKL